MPYRTFDDRIDGLVITFVNISDLKKVEERFLETQQVHQLLVNSSSDLFVQLTGNWKILEFNPEAEKFFGKAKKDVADQNFIELFISESSRKKTLIELNKLLKEGRGQINLPVKASGDNLQDVEWTVNVINIKNGPSLEVILIGKK
jgi:two-component system, chemotaxis family, CheB/CheR fusion protein